MSPVLSNSFTIQIKFILPMTFVLLKCTHTVFKIENYTLCLATNHILFTNINYIFPKKSRSILSLNLFLCLVDTYLFGLVLAPLPIFLRNALSAGQFRLFGGWILLDDEPFLSVSFLLVEISSKNLLGEFARVLGLNEATLNSFSKTGNTFLFFEWV